MVAPRRSPENPGATRGLPVRTVGAPPGCAPGVTRPAPGFGGIGGLSTPPELRRRNTGARPSAPGAAAAEQIRGAILKAQEKLVSSQRKLQSSVAATRGQLAPRR